VDKGVKSAGSKESESKLLSLPTNADRVYLFAKAQSMEVIKFWVVLCIRSVRGHSPI
jgi:hypothetical protein